MKLVGIYKIVSPSNKVYIGQSWNINNRKAQYKSGNCKSQSYLHRSFVKYGWINHKFSILCLLNEPTQEVLDVQEYYFWELYKKLGYKMLNIRIPGSKGKLSEESKRKISIAQKGKVRTLEQRQKMSLVSKGVPHSIGHVEKFKIPILQYNLDNTFVREWNSAREVASFLEGRDTTSITQCCKGNQKTAYGYKWKYKDELKQKPKYNKK